MRQFILPKDPAPDGTVVLCGGDYRYLSGVLRLSPDDPVEGRLPDGSLRSFRVASLDRRARTITLRPADERAGTGGVAPLVAVPPGFPFMVLFQWRLKGPKMDLVIRQATEAGVAAIVPVSGERCVALSAGDARGGRLERIVREARQQSGSPVATELLDTVPSSGVGAVWSELRARAGSFAQADDVTGSRSDRPAADRALVFTEAPLARKTLHRYLESGARSVALAVGPEGGMTDGEIDGLVAAGFECVHFATNVLRAETCALYAIAAVQNALMEIESWRSKE